MPACCVLFSIGCQAMCARAHVCLSGALSLASPGVPGNCRKQCSVPGSSLAGSTMVVLVSQMGILSAHVWCGTSVKNTMEETIMKRMIYVNHTIL